MEATKVWRIEVSLRPGLYDPERVRVAETARELGLSIPAVIDFSRLYVLEGPFREDSCRRMAEELLADPVADCYHIAEVLPGPASSSRTDSRHIAYVLFKPGVMDPVALSTEGALRELGFAVHQVRTGRCYRFEEPIPPHSAELVAYRVLANDAIEEVHWGDLYLGTLRTGQPYRFRRVVQPIRDLDDEGLLELSRRRMLSLDLTEMRAIHAYYRALQREPTDVELETVAQTWSEHCSHKTLKGPVIYREVGPNGELLRERCFESLLGETIFAATQQVRARLGPEDWCVRVFEDNAGVVRFDDSWLVCFKVETHNHPSAIEPYGGASTGLGGVIRDVLGTGLGAKPVASTDVFCVGPLDFPPDQLPRGVLHPRRLLKGVVAGVRDYGNRMGIPTVQGAVLSDPGYLANPLVYCGCVGLLPEGFEQKGPQDGDLIVVVGGRTGRDGIHGATFSSIELHSESAEVASGAVQIGNAITEKVMAEALLRARDRRLYRSITDCGAGGFSSAIGEMAASLGAEVWLDQVPLKYQGLSYTEIWISESQERMVLAVPEECWENLRQICASEGSEATVIGRFQATGRLVLRYGQEVVGDLDLQFLHRGCPKQQREAIYVVREPADPLPPAELFPATDAWLNQVLLRVLADWNICSKEWIIRQYDHEVQGGSVVKPLVGLSRDGPSDAAVVRPLLDRRRGLALASGINPRYGRLDPYWMAALAVDEAVRNVVCVGANPRRVALLDNFCWGNTNRPEQLGSLVRAALGCYDAAVAYETPFISGKDSLNNEYHGWLHEQPYSLTVPPSLLISALALVEDVSRCLTMDFKQPGSLVVLIGSTAPELGGSALAEALGWSGGHVPQVPFDVAKGIFRAVHQAIQEGLLRSCHDPSEGGLLVALAEMAFSGGLGAEIQLPPPQDLFPRPIDSADPSILAASWLFSESPSRFLLEVPEAAFPRLLHLVQTLAGPEAPVRILGRVTATERLRVWGARGSRGSQLVDASLEELKGAWQRPLRW